MPKRARKGKGGVTGGGAPGGGRALGEGEGVLREPCQGSLRRFGGSEMGSGRRQEGGLRIRVSGEPSGGMTR